MNTKIVAVLLMIILVLMTVYALAPKSYYSHDHPILEEIRSNFKKINPEYAKIPLREGDSAYAENKSMITMCLKDPDSGLYYDMNTLHYVALHELAHIISINHGHGEEFKRNFAKLLKLGEKLGFYNPNIPMPNTYCGVGSN